MMLLVVVYELWCMIEINDWILCVNSGKVYDNIDLKWIVESLLGRV